MSSTTRKSTPLGSLFDLPQNIFNMILDDVCNDLTGGMWEPDWHEQRDPWIEKSTGLIRGGYARHPLNPILDVSSAWKQYFLPRVLAQTSWEFTESKAFFDFLQDVSELGVEKPETFIRDLTIWSQLRWRGVGEVGEVVLLLKTIARGKYFPRLEYFHIEFDEEPRKISGWPPDSRFILAGMDLGTKDELFDIIYWLKQLRLPHAEVWGLGEPFLGARDKELHGTAKATVDRGDRGDM